jgi:hypothetical protein
MTIELPHKPLAFSLLIGLLAVGLAACGGPGGEGALDADPSGTETPTQEAEPVTLGPKDGHDLPPTDLERVTVGTLAPDFSLPDLGGEVFTLSSLRGEKNVVLVFYRGHW